jgi:MFS transporter, DHA3 family, macrolide efflux protein
VSEAAGVATPDSSSKQRPARLWNRSFAILWCGLIQSYLGDTFLAIGLMWLVYEDTGSAFAAGTVLALEGIPKLLGPLAGVIIDRTSKRMLMIGGDLLRGGLLLMLFALHLLGALALWHIYVTVVIMSTAGLFYGPSLKILLPTLVNDASPAASWPVSCCPCSDRLQHWPSMASPSSSPLRR